MRDSWIETAPGHDFPLENIPFGIISTPGREPRAATRIGETVIDLLVLSEAGIFDDCNFSAREVFRETHLNGFIALGKEQTRTFRTLLQDLFSSENPKIRDNKALRSTALFPIREVSMHMPVMVNDYTDFYSSLEHASNVGKMFRDASNPLLPNWKHMPVGYHGRSSTIVVSGTNIHRPKGQLKQEDSDFPVFGPTRQFDFELEMAFVTGLETSLGESVPVEKAEDYIFGMVLFNDLSARDIQKWEYVPLGPFLGKSFGSVISPWVITLEALEPFRVKGPVQDVPVLPYLQSQSAGSFDIHLEVFIRPENQPEQLVCRSNFKNLYWSMSQQLAHQTVNGCSISVGDLYASGTISGSAPDSFGSMLELAWKGTKPILMPDGSSRVFLHDHDTVIMRGYCEKDGLRIGFGDVTTTVLPAK
jgi:fumarylacetoacetase